MSTNIEWTNETWNPIVGCSRVSAGCARCYAATAAASPRLQRFPQYQAVKDWDGTVQFVESQLLKPLHWRQSKKIFVCSMADLFHENVPFQWIDKIFALMHFAHRHTFQVLTKRPQRALEYFTDYLSDVGSWIEIPQLQSAVNLRQVIPLPNVHIGVSTENQRMADERIPILMKIPSSVRFLSCEPLLEAVDLKFNTACLPNWVIVGGESGPNSRPCHLEWIESIVKQCRSANISVFVKQLGANAYREQQQFQKGDKKGGNIAEFPEHLQIREFPHFICD